MENIKIVVLVNKGVAEVYNSKNLPDNIHIELIDMDIPEQLSQNQVTSLQSIDNGQLTNMYF